ncbi:MAG TPA: DUF4136 domain-containing protein [Gemmatimonadaceae bacterium]|nr:DUF4136 domain-containing protein [Gemmatimonadaceae bacterium]
MRALVTVIVLALGAGSASCYPDQITSTTQLASVTTLVDSQAPLRAAHTFALPDTIIHSKQIGAAAITRAGDAQIIARIRDGFLALGWQEVTNVAAQRPDVVVLTAVLEQMNTGVFYSDWWANWGWWPGWPVGYGPDWVWTSPTNAVAFTYSTGTLLITMLDIRHGNTAGKRVPLLWAAGVQGVLTASSLSGALTGIDQAFAQSPYLERQ